MVEHHSSPPAIVERDGASQDATPSAPDTAPHTLASTGGGHPSGGAERLLTVEALLQARPRLAPALRAAGCEVRAVAQWEGLLDAIEGERTGATLIDLDAANRAAHSDAPDASEAPHGAPVLSGHRLVSLLARRAREKRISLVVQTALDFAEIEELIHQGIHALIHPDLNDDVVAAYIVRAMAHGAPATLSADAALEGALAWGVARWTTPDDTTIPPALG